MKAVRTPPGFLPTIKSERTPPGCQSRPQECRLQLRALAFADRWSDPLLFHTYDRGERAALVYQQFILHFNPDGTFRLLSRLSGADRKYLNRIKTLAQAVIDADLAEKKGPNK